MRTFELERLWAPELNPLEVVLRAAIVYVAVWGVFRLAGRKAFQRWGPPEIVLLFLVSTALRKTLVADDESITTGLIAFVTLVGLDRIATSLTARWRHAADVVEGPVVRLVRAGELDRAAMARVRLGEHELLARVRARGRERLDEIRDAWFERSGEVTIVFKR